MKFGKLAIVLALLVFLLLPALVTAEETAEEPTESTNILTYISTNDIAGEPFDSAALEGKIVMLNFWATWCPPCVQELPHLDALAKEFDGRIVVLGVLLDAIDSTGNLDQSVLNKALALYESSDVAYTSLVPDDVLLYITGAIGLNSMPTTLFIDEEGVAQGMLVGSRDEDGWREIITQVLTTLESEETE